MSSGAPTRIDRVGQIVGEALSMAPNEREVFIQAASQGDPQLLELIANRLEQELAITNPPPLPKVSGNSPLPKLSAGQKMGGFVILSELGSGSFGSVYLAFDRSLVRQVALKVCRQVRSEARIMATLEHDNIVRVFSKVKDSQTSLKLISMQFVPGASLEQVMQKVAALDIPLSGKVLLNELDALGKIPVPFNPSSIDARQRLAAMSYVDACLWLGVQIADALSYAHEKGVLHLDVKPGNILINSYGRPMLTDFNVSQFEVDIPTTTTIGGTESYMSPEHKLCLEKLSRGEELPPLDGRADVFSLGVVLVELLKMAPSIPTSLREILDKATHVRPEARFQTPGQLSKALENFMTWSELQRSLPKISSMFRWLAPFPFVALTLAAVLPQVAASVINIVINSLDVLTGLTPTQQALFDRVLANYYDPAVYVALVGIWSVQMLRVRARMHKERTLDRLARQRRSILGLTSMVLFLSSIGWLTAIPLFSVLIHWMDGPVTIETVGHFMVTFALSWAIAASYSVLGVLYVVVRLIYPALWSASDSVSAAKTELKMVVTEARLFRALTAVIPLTAAFSIVLIGPESLTAGQYQALRVVLALLIILGMMGAFLASRLANEISATAKTFLDHA